jgi:hypothetical protein
MNAIPKKLVVDEQGRPHEVIIGWEDFQEISEVLGWDLDEDTVHELRQAREDRERGVAGAYVDLGSL